MKRRKFIATVGAAAVVGPAILKNFEADASPQPVLDELDEINLHGKFGLLRLDRCVSDGMGPLKGDVVSIFVKKKELRTLGSDGNVTSKPYYYFAQTIELGHVQEIRGKYAIVMPVTDDCSLEAWPECDYSIRYNAMAEVAVDQIHQYPYTLEECYYRHKHYVSALND